MSEFGQLMRQLRLSRGLSTHRLAEKIDTFKGYVSGMETGNVAPPSVKFLKKIARVLRVPEKKLILIAYLDKAPREIQKELQSSLSRKTRWAKAILRRARGGKR